VSENDQLSHKTEDKPEAVILYLSGEIDSTHSNELSELLTATREATKKNLIIDLTEVKYIDSAGLGVLVSEHTRWVKRGSQFRLCNPNLTVQTVLQTSHLDHFFDIYPSQEEALQE